MAEGKPNFRVVERLKIKIGEWYNIITLRLFFRVVYLTCRGAIFSGTCVDGPPRPLVVYMQTHQWRPVNPRTIFMNDLDVFVLCLGDAKNLGKGHSSLRDGHCTITLDQEEIFRTATIEKAIE